MNEALLSQLFLKDTAFHDLMRQRITNVLLIASTYDAFMMEEDGRVEEQIFFEYMSLNLSSPPRVTRVPNFDEAFEAIREKEFDLIIAMPGVDVSETFVKAKDFKRLRPQVPFVVLTPFSREVSRRLQNEDFSAVDYVFSWLGNVDLLVAIIKLIEDKMNAENDVQQVGIQMILLVEDSVRFYSSILPTLYNFILRQSRQFSTEALNAHETMMRMRGRPKVMLARNYDEAVALYDKYRDHILGVISDVSFARGGVKDKQAGLKLAKYLRSQDANLPIIIESSDSENASRMAEFDGTFLDKNSKKLPVDLGNAVMKNFGFGDFVIVNPESGEEIMRIHNLKELQDNIFNIPAESLLYHAQHNHISRWLYSRALFPIAQVVKMHRFRDISEAPAVRQLFFDLIVKYRKMKNRGVVAEFHKDRFDRYSNFARIGKGSLGGKGRGLAFIDSMIKNNPVCDNFEGAVIRIPHTVVLCTDVFDEFMELNGLYPLALSNIPDADILKAFLAAKIPESVEADLRSFYDVLEGPLAVRSSSLLEDSHYQPFAGVYSTYMIPHFEDRELTIRYLCDAVKGVYASVFFADSKAYMVATRNVIDQEKMAVIIQEAVGQQHGDHFYPSFSGVGRSLNYYPVGDEQPADGIAEVAVGLGKYIVDGGMALRFSPRHPSHVLQTSTLDLALRDTQRFFYGLSTGTPDREFSIDEGFDIARLRVDDAGKQGYLKYLVSTYDFQNERIIDSDEGMGRKVVTFANVLQHGAFPMAQAIDFMLSTGQQEMGRPVEIEFAGVLASPKEMSQGVKGALYWLQIRPMVDRREMLDEEVLHAESEQILISSNNALGHGMMDGVQHVVMVKPEKFSMANNVLIAEEIAKINCNFTNSGEGYILIGVGRWGSSDSALGIPVKWPHISSARLIVEVAAPHNAIEPSQGTHFFQNLTSFGVGYFTVGMKTDSGVLDADYLAQLPAVYESEFVRIVRFDEPLQVAINGMKGQGVVLKPQHNVE
ncbi:MAG: PEP/pyruvate-binding domain-containing protein [Bacteroidales bacterium]|nr:PEP/pyruvate-binding domain-containing protein [Bacteroidales bacterium]